MSIKKIATVLSLLLLADAGSTAWGYGIWGQYNGRQAREAAGYYDLNGEAWSDTGIALGADFTFDWSVDFPMSGGSFAGPFANASVRNTWKSNLSSAISSWANWADIKIGAEKPAGQGHVRFTFNTPGVSGGTQVFSSTGDPITSSTVEFDIDKVAYWDRPYINTTTGNPDPAAVPVGAQIAFSSLHEFGHVLGLDDLYLGYTEEFVDHTVAGNPNPDRSAASRTDNIMQGCNAPGASGCNYAHNPVIDNDEIAGVTWLWGGPYNQIITADLDAAWKDTSLSGRDTEEHHGDQLNAGPLGWWDYRGSIVEADGKKPYIDIAFAGYENFGAATYPSAPVIYGGNQGNGIERFIIDQEGWVGNFELFLKSTHTEEHLIDAWIVGSRTDAFILDPNQNGLAFQNGNEWAMVFGPIPEPTTLTLALAAALFIVPRRRSTNDVS